MVRGQGYRDRPTVVAQQEPTDVTGVELYQLQEARVQGRGCARKLLEFILVLGFLCNISCAIRLSIDMNLQLISISLSVRTKSHLVACLSAGVIVFP